MAYTPPIVNYNLIFPGTGGEVSSFTDIGISSPSSLASGTVYDGWCLDQTKDISPGTHQGLLYSSYELGLLQANGVVNAATLDHLDNINWLINSYQRHNLSSYTYGEVQGAIWNLTGNNYHDSVNLGTYSDANIATLTTLALKSLAAGGGEGFVPGLNDYIGMIIDTRDAAVTAANPTGQSQPIIIETKTAALGDFVWNDSNANGIQDAGELGIAGATVNLWRDLNGNGTIDAGEIVASKTTDAAGAYSFTGLAPGLAYQVQFIQPAGYDSASPVSAPGSTPANDSNGLLSAPVVLAPGENNITIDSGFYKLASIGDRVWYDTNGNGIQDATETGGASGLVVKLYNAANVVVASQLTDANGNYLFTGLIPGSYSVQFATPTGYVFTTKDASGNTLDASDSDADTTTGRTINYTLNSGDVNLTVDAGLIPAPKAHLGDFVWNDLNANGIQDAGEAGINGVTVKLLNSAGTVIGSTVTAGNGGYGFDVTPGTYAVQFVKPSGYVPTVQDANSNSQDAADSDASPTTGITGNYTLAAGDNNLTIDAGFYKLASLGDRVWYDSNGNGIQDSGEVGVPGVVVDLLSGSTVIASQTTNASGNYLFTGLAPGAYSVQFVAPNGYTFTTKNAGSDDTVDSDANSSGKTINYTLNSGDVNLTVDAGLIQPKAHLGDFVWNDLNANGIQDAGEPGINGVTVNLLNSAGTVIGSTVTAGNGGYGFDVTPGTYAVQFVKPSGYVPTVQNANSNSQDAADSDASTTTGTTGNYTLAAGDNNLTIDAGFYKTAAIGDFIWYDNNKNGIQDSGETGVSGVKVDLYFGSTKLATTTTDSNGKYLFTGLTPGDYHIDVQEGTLPANYVFTAQNQGSNDAVDSDANSTGVMATTTLTSGETDLTWDAGIYSKPLLTGAIGDRVWRDHNENGIQDNNSTEPGIPGVHVSLYTSAGVLVGKQDTNSNGNYLFTGLAEGDYYVQFDKTNVIYNAPSPNPGTFTLNTWYFAQKNVGTNDAIDSDAGSASGKTLVNVAKTDVFHLNAGQTDLTRDAGITPIVINLDGHGIQTISRTDSAGTFDLFGNGHAISSGWIAGGSGFLAVDKSGNGKIDDISELFGGTTKGAGFAQLASYDSNHDGVVDAKDTDFGKLLIWQDLNGDHQSSADELMTLAQAGIASLKVSYADTAFIDAQGNLHGESSSATLASGASVEMTDLYFNVATADANAAGVALPTMAELLGSSTLDNLVGPAAPSAAASPVSTEQIEVAETGDAMRRIAALMHEQTHAVAA